MEREFYLNPVEASSHDTDPWGEINTFGGIGDGILFCPGTPGPIGGVPHIAIEGIQLKRIREGLEDYEYFPLVSPKWLPIYLDQRVSQLPRKTCDCERSSGLRYSLKEEFGERVSARGSSGRGRDFGDRERNERSDKTPPS